MANDIPLQGTFVDPATSLTWKKCVIGQTYQVDKDGVEHCINPYQPYTGTQVNTPANIAALYPWRVPTITELRSLVDYSRYRPALSPVFFPNLPQKDLWSSTLLGYSHDTEAYKYPDIYGSLYLVDVFSGKVTFEGLQASHPVLLVSGPTASEAKPDSRYRTDIAGGVYDNVTELLWKTCVEGQSGKPCSGIPKQYTWDEAQAVASVSREGGFTDWRLPTANELQSLLDYTIDGFVKYPEYILPLDLGTRINHTVFVVDPINGGFTGTEFWTDTISAIPEFGFSDAIPFYLTLNSAWTVFMDFGYNDAYSSKSTPHYVRLVRGKSQATTSLTVSTSGDGKVSNRDKLISYIDCGSGSSNCTNNFEPGKKIVLSACPVPPWGIAGQPIDTQNATYDGCVVVWGGSCSGTATTCTLTMNAPKVVTAAFPPVAPAMTTFTAHPLPAVTAGNIVKPGDCDNSGTVSIAEVQSAINMFLGMKTVAGCVDTGNDGSVSISEVQKVINGFLGL